MKFVNVLLCVCTFVKTARECGGYRILAIYPLPIQSHFLMINQLLKGLARKGHQVDFINMIEQKETYPNYTQIITLPNNLDMFGSHQLNYENLKNFRSNFSTFTRLGYKVCQSMGHPEFLKLARNPPKDPPYDLMIMHFGISSCFMILGHLWNIPIVLISTTALYPWMHDMIGNPENAAFSSNNAIVLAEGNGFWGRFTNTVLLNIIKFTYLYQSSNQDELLQNYFGKDAVPVRELERTASLVLMNTYFPINGVKPMTTGLIEIGGLHIQNDGPDLTSELKNWLDESKSGVIYLNFGSIIQLDILPDGHLDIIFNTLSSVAPIRVLARISKPEKLSRKLPKNFFSLPWIPQEKVLQHPNILAFITHGGLLGTQEAVYYGVPMLCMPAIVDQWTNSHIYIEKKIAVRVGLTHITQENFNAAVKEILNNHIYKENIKRLSSLFRDRPKAAMDTAIFWIEFVIRNGKDVLRSPAMDLTWWQVALLDVYAVILTILSLVAIILIFTFKFLLRSLLRRLNNFVLKDKKSN